MSPSTHSILELDGVSKRFGTVVVSDEMTFSVPAGQCVGVLGPNGAGKTTLLNLISGLLRPDSGAIRLDGRDILSDSAAKRCKAGIGRAFQVPRPFGKMTVLENILVAATFGRNSSEREAAATCERLLDETGLSRVANRTSGALPLLDRKRLEFARALATAPRVLLLDEIAGGLTDGEWAELVVVVDGARRRGTTIVWIEHVVHALLAVADRLIVVDFGRKIADGVPQEVFHSPLVRQTYLGIDVE